MEGKWVLVNTIINLYDGIFEKDDTKEYKLVKKIFSNKYEIYYFESIEKSTEEILKIKIEELNEELQSTQEVLDVLILSQM